MNFLALSPLALTLLAATTCVVLIASYFLKLRHRRITIASSLLWNRVLERREERSFWEKLRRLLSVLLAVVIGLLMVFALARPEIAALTGTAGRTMIVLDTSPSMLARMSDGRTRWQHAVEIAKSLVASGDSGTEFRISGTSESFDSPFSRDSAQVTRSIEAMKPVASTPRFPEALEVDDAAVQRHFVSDGVAALPVPVGTLKYLVHEPAQNVGITAFEVRAMPSTPLSFEAFLEVTNFGSDVRKTSIRISEGGPGKIARETEIQPGQSYSSIFDLSTFEGGGIRASIQSTADALAADDVAYTYLPLKKKARTLLVTKGNAYLQAALKLDSFVELSIVDPKDFREDPGIDTYVFDGFAPQTQPARPALIVGTANAPWLPRATGTVERPAFSSWLEDHPVMQYLSLHDVSIAKASVIDATNVTQLASSGRTPLIVGSMAGAPGSRWIMLTFDLQSSDFPVHESFPLFVDNSLAWFGRERLALRRTTGLVEIPLSHAQISGPDGKPVTSHSDADHTVFEAQDPGLYVAVKDGVRQYVAVNLMTRRYSNINGRALNWKSDSPPAARLLKKEPWFYLLGIAAMLLGLEWLTYHRRITL